MDNHTALLIVDVQNDFLPPDGSLAVQNGRDILPHIVDLLDERWDWPLVVASQDYHPQRHISFASRHPGKKPFETVQVRDSTGKVVDQILWPDHCVQGTRGCEIEDTVKQALEPWKAKNRFHLVQKGADVDLDAYSAFATPTSPSASASSSRATNPSASPLTEYLRSRSIRNLIICGIATDVCVSETVLDALSEGFSVKLVQEARKGVDASKVEQTLDELRGKGVRIVARLE